MAETITVYSSDLYTAQTGNIIYILWYIPEVCLQYFTVVLICVEEYMLRKVMMAAHEQGMTNGEYVFIYPNLLPSKNWERLYYDGNFSEENNEIAMDAYGPLIQVRFI